MKRKVLEKHFRDHGSELHHHGARHDVWVHQETGAQSTVPRHNEINTFTAREICRQLAIPGPPGR